MPGIGGNLYNHPPTLRNVSIQNTEPAQQQPNNFYQNSQQFNAFPQSASVPPPILQESLNPTNFAQPPPVSPPFDMPNQQHMRSSSIGQPQNDQPAAMPTNWNSMFDPSDPALFNFDLASMNFGNHYGALEFGMLGHMATGADATPPSDSATHRGSIGTANGQYQMPLGSFNDTAGGQTLPYTTDTSVTDWANGQNLYGQPLQREAPHAFAIETNNPSFMSPESGTSDTVTKFEDSPTMTTTSYRPSAVTSAPSTASSQKQQAPPARPSTHLSTPQLQSKSQIPTKSTRRRDPSSIYTSVTSPYPYTAGFHSLIAYLQRRLASSPGKTLAIAKSLASIRPSFIATTKTLNRDDLIFMEKCFQRTLWEYEGFIESVGTPTIVARRTGEVAAVGKEFSILTGWKKDVLLGREPNLNVNRGGSSPSSDGAGLGSAVNTAGRGTGVNTPIIRPMQKEESSERRLQPVFLAELLDDESVVEFYEDFARLAFGDSRGSVMGRGKLLKYRTKEEELERVAKMERDAKMKPSGDAKGGDEKMHEPGGGEPSVGMKRMNSGTLKKQSELKREGIQGERGMQKLGFKDGKVECTYCWTVKRDVFDIPMLIVMNVSPTRRSKLFWGY